MIKSTIGPDYPRAPDSTGGSAFPLPRNPNGGPVNNGMTLRDYFAAQAMQGFIANKDRPTRFSPEEDASYCYAIADAMLEARK